VRFINSVIGAQISGPGGTGLAGSIYSRRYNTLADWTLFKYHLTEVDFWVKTSTLTTSNIAITLAPCLPENAFFSQFFSGGNQRFPSGNDGIWAQVWLRAYTSASVITPYLQFKNGTYTQLQALPFNSSALVDGSPHKISILSYREQEGSTPLMRAVLYLDNVPIWSSANGFTPSAYVPYTYCGGLSGQGQDLIYITRFYSGSGQSFVYRYGSPFNYNMQT
jgi:hypothetical protein